MSRFLANFFFLSFLQKTVRVFFTRHSSNLAHRIYSNKYKSLIYTCSKRYENLRRHEVALKL